MPRGMVADAVRIQDGPDVLGADLHLPGHARGLVIFAHGSGSSRFSSRNRQVAESLNHAGYATLLLDLLTQKEERIDVRTADTALQRNSANANGDLGIAAVDGVEDDGGTRAVANGNPAQCTGIACAAAASAAAR